MKYLVFFRDGIIGFLDHNKLLFNENYVLQMREYKSLNDLVQNVENYSKLSVNFLITDNFSSILNIRGYDEFDISCPETFRLGIFHSLEQQIDRAILKAMKHECDYFTDSCQKTGLGESNIEKINESVLKVYSSIFELKEEYKEKDIKIRNYFYNFMPMGLRKYLPMGNYEIIMKNLSYLFESLNYHTLKILEMVFTANKTHFSQQGFSKKEGEYIITSPYITKAYFEFDSFLLKVRILLDCLLQLLSYSYNCEIGSSIHDYYNKIKKSKINKYCEFEANFVNDYENWIFKLKDYRDFLSHKGPFLDVIEGYPFAYLTIENSMNSIFLPLLDNPEVKNYRKQHYNSKFEIVNYTADIFDNVRSLLSAVFELTEYNFARLHMKKYLEEDW